MTAENGLEVAQRFARARGWYCLPLIPLTKLPGLKDYYGAATLDPAVLAGQWGAARRYSHWLESKHPDFEGITNDGLVREVLKARAFDENWHNLPPGIGVNLAASGLVGVDVDTFTQERVWSELCDRHGYDPGPRTVGSPGVINRDGSSKHDGLGHFYYSLPEDLRDLNQSNTAVNLSIGEIPSGYPPQETTEDWQDPRPALMTGRRYLVIPPTQRPEGFYVRTEGADVRSLPTFLADILREKFTNAAAAKKRREEIVSHMVKEDRLWKWYMSTPWARVLPSDWSLMGYDGTCEVFAHPKSSRSAVAHAPGCEHLNALEGTAPPPITFHSTTVPEYITAALKSTPGGQSVSKLKLLAFKEFDGDLRAARRSLGLPDRSPRRHAPTRQKSHVATLSEQIIRVRRPLPNYDNIPDTPTTITLTLSESPVEPGGGRADVVRQTPAPRVETSRACEARVKPTKPAKTPKSVEQLVNAEPAEPAESFVDITAAELDDMPEWVAEHPMNKLHAFVSDKAVPASADLLNSIQQREIESGNFCGMPNQPNLWKPWHLAARKDRTALVEVEHFSTTEAAEHLGVPTYRAQSWLRALIPVMREYGVLLREREEDKEFNTYSDTATASGDTCWAAWRLVNG